MVGWQQEQRQEELWPEPGGWRSPRGGDGGASRLARLTVGSAPGGRHCSPQQYLGTHLTLPLALPPPRPHSARHHLQVLDEFAQENIRSLYKFNFSENRDVLSANDRAPQPAFYLDRGIRLQRLGRPGGQNRVGFRLVSVPRPERSWHAVTLQDSERGVGRRGGRAEPSPHPAV